MKTEAGLDEHKPWPRGLAEIVAFYGDADRNRDAIRDPVWEIEFLTIVPLPYPMLRSWPDAQGWYPPVEHVRVHRKCAWALIAALERFMHEVGEDTIHAEGWDYWGGCDNWRPQTGLKSLPSIHSWAAGQDINPHLGEYGKPSEQPEELVKAFAHFGATWGGDWPNINPAWPSDPMHWQWASGY